VDWGRNTGARWVFGGVRKPLIERYILGVFRFAKNGADGSWVKRLGPFSVRSRY